MLPGAAFLAALVLAQAAAAQDNVFDADKYPEATAAEMVKKNPCKPDASGYDVKDVLFSFRAQYRPELRPQSKARHEVLRRWTVKINAADQARRFTRELRAGRQAGAPWAAVTQEQIDGMKGDLKPGESVWFYVSFIGCVGSEPAFALDEYEPVEYDDLYDDAASVIT